MLGDEEKNSLLSTLNSPGTSRTVALRLPIAMSLCDYYELPIGPTPLTDSSPGGWSRCCSMWRRRFYTVASRFGRLHPQCFELELEAHCLTEIQARYCYTIDPRTGAHLDLLARGGQWRHGKKTAVDIESFSCGLCFYEDRKLSKVGHRYNNSVP
ncbi:hypothetical protein BDZ89DRAFT_544317 [Hymenopellis radicata]|nr:hypothetical protein BDZ89DRAFT_544317 [Hymenopellis radicata]